MWYMRYGNLPDQLFNCLNRKSAEKLKYNWNGISSKNNQRKKKIPKNYYVNLAQILSCSCKSKLVLSLLLSSFTPAGSPWPPLSSLIYDCTFLRLGYVTILSYWTTLLCNKKKKKLKIPKTKTELNKYEIIFEKNTICFNSSGNEVLLKVWSD